MAEESTLDKDVSVQGSAIEEDFRFLAEASGELAGSLEYHRTLATVADLLVSKLCDYCLIYLRNDGKLQRVAGKHREQEGQVLVDRIMSMEVADPTALIPSVIDSGRSTVIQNTSHQELPSVDPELLEIRRRLNPTSFVCVPLVAGGKGIGAILCVRSHGNEPYQSHHVSMLEELARRAAAAIEHARIFERSIQESERRRKAESRLQTLLNANLVAVCFTKFDGTVVDANDSFLAMVGATREQLTQGQLDWRVVTAKEDMALSEQIVEQLRTHGTSGPIEKRYLQPDGTCVTAMLMTTRLSEDEADAMTVAVDISARKKAEEAQRYLNSASVILASSLDYEQTLQNLGAILVPELAEWFVAHLIEDGVPTQVAITHEDPEQARWAIEVSSRYPTNLKADHGVGKVLSTGEPEFYPRVVPEEIEASAIDEEHLAALRRLQIGGVMIVPMKIRDRVIGALTFVTSTPDRYSNEDLDFAMEIARRAAIAVDHSQLFRSVEHKVEERTQELVAVNRELESFAYSVSHDLRAPLRSVMSASMIVLEDYGDQLGDEGQHELKRAAAAAKRMSTLIDDLLQFSRLGRKEMNRQEVDLSAMARMIGRETGIPDEGFHVEPGIIVDADPDLLRVLLTNLIENAWKFTKERELPRIAIGREGEALFVRDNGVGFDEEFSDKLFMPFERLHSPQDYPGTGIGLANVKRIVTRHGGKIWAQGKVGEGAEFFFTL